MDISKFISHQIESQFPAVYKEDGKQLVDLVKSYYNFLERDVTGYYVTGYTLPTVNSGEKAYFSRLYPTYSAAAAEVTRLQSLDGYRDVKIVDMAAQSIYHNRRMFEYNDIDSTLSRMLISYKDKYLNDLPFGDIDIRFIVKHILDFYRRKGSKEGLELFFRLFYGENVELYYPSQDILKPSSSRWKSNQYIELYPQDPETLRGVARLPVYGSISKASAVIDRVSFLVVGNTFVPVVYLSNVRGNFVGYDDLVNNGVTYGRVRGSLESITISETDIRLGVSNNAVGDILDVSSATGAGARARVSKVTSQISGEVGFVLNDGGFGYTTTNTDIIISDQTVFVNDPDLRLFPTERVFQSTTGAAGIIIGQRITSSDTVAIGVLLSSSNTFSSGGSIATIDRDVNVSSTIVFAGPRNATASADISPVLTNTQQVSIIVDLIEDYLSVPLDAANYSASPAVVPMSGNSPLGIPPITLTTTLSDAFIPQTFEIGTITGFVNVNPGVDYVNDVFALARENTLSRFDLVNQIIQFDPITGNSIEIGNIITQNDPTIDLTNKDVRGIVKSRDGNFIEVMQLSFQSFSAANAIFIEGSSTPIDVITAERNYDSLPLGLNASIDGFVSSSIGKIEEVQVFDSGIGFLHEAPVVMKNLTKIDEARMTLESARNNPLYTPQRIQALEDALTSLQNQIVIQGLGSALGQGKTQGVWESKTSHLNSNKVLQDSFFYQDFSYQVTTKLNPTTYADTLRNLAHVAGTKVFYGFGLDDDINIGIGMASELVKYTVYEVEISTEETDSITTEDDTRIGSLEYYQTEVIEG